MEEFKKIEELLKMAKKQFKEEKEINSEWFIKEIANHLYSLDTDYGYEIKK